MRKQSLQDIMSDMIQRLEATEPGAERNHHRNSLSEIGAYASLDSVLADLYRQYLNARKRYKKLERVNGKDDPMAAVAHDQTDSLDSAVQTRLLELRQRRLIREKAEEKLAQAAAMEREESRSASVSELLRTKLETIDFSQTACKNKDDDEDALLLGALLLLQLSNRKITNSLTSCFRFAGDMKQGVQAAG